MVSTPVCTDCNICIDETFCCPECGEMPCTYDLWPFLKVKFDKLIQEASSPQEKICVISPYIESTVNTPAMPIILYYMYKNAVDEHEVTFRVDNFRVALFNKIPSIRQSKLCMRFGPLNQKIKEFKEVFTLVEINNYKNDHRPT